MSHQSIPPSSLMATRHLAQIDNLSQRTSSRKASKRVLPSRSGYSQRVLRTARCSFATESSSKLYVLVVSVLV